jgi:hypothetical protein
VTNEIQEHWFPTNNDIPQYAVWYHDHSVLIISDSDVTPCTKDTLTDRV